MKQKITKKYIRIAAMLFLLFCGFIGTKQVIAATRTLEKLEGYYTGLPLEVGAKIDTRDIFLLAEYTVAEDYWTTTDYEEVKSGFKLSPSTVKQSGMNEIVVSYNNKTTVIYVEGKKVEYITAEYLGTEVYVGAKIPVDKFDVYAYFSDGTSKKIKNFKLSSAVIEKDGINLIVVTYEGKTAETYVYGKAPLAVEEIIAYYEGEPIIEGNPINKANIDVMVLYNDGTMKQVTNFNLNPTTVPEAGLNEITITYGGVSTVIDVYGLEKFIDPESVKVTYKGHGVELGDSVKPEDIEVKVTYNDNSTGTITDFGLYGETIWEEGINTVVVYNDEFSAEVVVYGIKGFSGDFSNGISQAFFDGNGAFSEVTLAITWGLEEDKFKLVETDMDILNRSIHRLISTQEFIAFELVYDDDEMVEEFPMGMKVTIPKGYDPEQFAVYYKTKYSTTMAKLDGKFMDEEKTEYQVIAYNPGIYILVNEASSVLVESIKVETEQLTLNPRRNYDLNPIVYPANADNRSVTYWSSDEEVAVVSQSGKIKTLTEGSCEIWIEAADDSGVYTIIYLEVEEGKKIVRSVK